MAYLAEDPNKQNQEDPNNPVSQPAPGQTGQSGIISSGSAGFSAMNAQPGMGGQMQQANMQDYLAANQGQSKTADNLRSTVGGQFQKESQNLESKANESKAQARDQVSQSHLSPAEAAKAVTDMQAQYATRYAPAQPQTDQFGAVTTQVRDGTNSVAYTPERSYDDAKGLLTSKLSYNYAGPSTFDYAFEAPTQTYGESLKSEPAFKNTLASLYKQSNQGKSMGAGMMALQDQLDSNDLGLSQARQELGSQYTDLLGARDTTRADVLSEIENAKSGVESNKAALKGNLEGMATGSEDALRAAAEARNREIRDSWDGSLTLGGQAKDYASKEAAAQDIASYLKGELSKFGSQADGYYVHGVNQDTPNLFKSVIDQMGTDTLANKWTVNPLSDQGWYDETSIEGVEDQRDKFNSVMDALGQNTRKTFQKKEDANQTGSKVDSSIQKFLNTYSSNDVTMGGKYYDRSWYDAVGNLRDDESVDPDRLLVENRYRYLTNYLGKLAGMQGYG